MKKSILSIAAILLSCTVLAQNDTLRAVVNVNNEYTPVLIKVDKKNFVPSNSSKTKKSTPKYRFTSEAMPFNGFVSERNNKELIKEEENPYKGYARAGYGIGGMVDLKAAYRTRLGERDLIKATASLDGYMTDIDRIENNSSWESRMYNSNIAVGYTHLFDGLKLNVTGEFNNRLFNYQSMGTADNDTDKQNSKELGIRIDGATIARDGYGYRFDAGFANNSRKYSAGTDNGINESRIKAGGAAWYNFGHDEGGVGIAADVETFLYNKALRDAKKPFDNYISVDANPYVSFILKGWDIRLGAKMNILTGNGARLAFAPDVKIATYLTKNISFFAKATGGRTENNFSRLESISPYWNLDEASNGQLKPTYKVIDAVSGATITYKSLSVDLSAGYAYTKYDVLQTFEATSSTVYSIIYTGLVQDNTHNAHASMRIGYDLGGWLKIAGDARYDYWKCGTKELLAMRPEFTFKLNAEMKPIRGLTLNAIYDFTCYTKCDGNKRISSKNDLGIRASYEVLPWLGMYLQGNNLLNDSYYEYAGYEARGIRGLLGATVSF